MTNNDSATSNKSKRKRLVSTEETKIARSRSDGGIAMNRKNKELFDGILNRHATAIKLIDIELDRIANTLRFAQPNDLSGNFDIRWWSLLANQSRKPVLIRWVRKLGFPKLIPEPVQRVYPAKYMKENGNKHNSAEVLACVQHTQMLIRKRDQLNFKTAVILRGMDNSLVALEKLLVESRPKTGNWFLQVGRNNMAQNYCWSPNSQHMVHFPDIDFNKVQAIPDPAIAKLKWG